MKFNYKILILVIGVILLSIFIFFRNYNKIENVENRARKYCIKNNNEYRVVLNSDGTESKICVVSGNKINIIEYYNNR